MSMSDAASSPPASAALPGTAADGIETPERRIRLAILDDHEVLLDALSTWIGANARDFEVVLVAATWLQLVHSANFPTDLVFIDFQLNEPVSIEARVRTCRAAGAKVVVLTSLDTREARDRALAAGAADFLSKSLPMSEVMDAARRVMGLQGEQPTERSWRPLPVGGAAAHARPRLSPGEEEALRLYVAGHSTAGVAENMNVQYETAKTYLRRVREKYARVGRPAGKKAELIRRAAEDGYLQ
ncbi:response regulator transcription factor [Homoserinibacter sp. YIM 151385]|uniref:response regulator transcription factor n=1 Tax=Homoserinibacter sp. YIM 151385 TaxID=2985506 RepID=UPI0022F14456|nr:response regulator transcription factor [Homoserinibacter sp. YIM 151385]WBU36875.1 response regulator transcription factor [Homoserinibacter sp. YIM 151385]